MATCEGGGSACFRALKAVLDRRTVAQARLTGAWGAPGGVSPVPSSSSVLGALASTAASGAAPVTRAGDTRIVGWLTVDDLARAVANACSPPAEGHQPFTSEVPAVNTFATPEDVDEARAQLERTAVADVVETSGRVAVSQSGWNERVSHVVKQLFGTKGPPKEVVALLDPREEKVLATIAPIDVLAFLNATVDVAATPGCTVAIGALDVGDLDPYTVEGSGCTALDVLALLTDPAAGVDLPAVVLVDADGCPFSVFAREDVLGLASLHDLLLPANEFSAKKRGAAVSTPVVSSNTTLCDLIRLVCDARLRHVVVRDERTNTGARLVTPGHILSAIASA